MRLQYTPALSTNSKTLDENLFRAYAESGMQAMEISLKPQEYSALDYSEIKQWAEKYNITLWSLHLPFSPFDALDPSNPRIAGQTVARFKEYIQKASAIGIKIFVVHASGEPIEDSDRGARMTCAKNSLRQLAEYADSLGCTVAVENLPRSCLGKNSAEIAELISGHGSLRVCFDTNHLLGEDPVSFIRYLGDKIITLHVSDYDRVNERHWLPGEGCVDWVSLVSALESVGYRGCWLYELALDTPWSIDRPRELTCADFIENYRTLMQKKLPVPFGQPKENLGMWSIVKK